MNFLRYGNIAIHPTINVINIPKICPMALIASQFIIFYSSSSMNFRLVKNSIYNTFYLIFRTLSVYTACGQYSLINAISNIYSASLILGPNTISISSSTLSSISKNESSITWYLHVENYISIIFLLQTISNTRFSSFL